MAYLKNRRLHARRDLAAATRPLREFLAIPGGLPSVHRVGAQCRLREVGPLAGALLVAPAGAGRGAGSRTVSICRDAGGAVSHRAARERAGADGITVAESFCGAALSALVAFCASGRRVMSAVALRRHAGRRLADDRSMRSGGQRNAWTLAVLRTRCCCSTSQPITRSTD